MRQAIRFLLLLQLTKFLHLHHKTSTNRLPTTSALLTNNRNIYQLLQKTTTFEQGVHQVPREWLLGWSAWAGNLLASLKVEEYSQV